MINFSAPWNQTTYDNTIYRIILPLESKGGTPDLNVHIDSQDYATIGAGFLVRTQAESILTTLFLRFYGQKRNPLKEEVDVIKAAVTDSNGMDKKFASAEAAQSAINTALQTVLKDSSKTFAFANAEEVKKTFVVIDQKFEKQLDNTWSAPNEVPLSRERVALLSLAYNAVLANSPTLIKDVGSLGDRADAWYQIRYDSNGGNSKSVGIAKRRFYESSLFGLSADLNAPTLNEAQGAYRMFNNYHSNILNYEKLWGELPSGQRALNLDGNKRTAIEAVSTDYAGILGDANLSATNTATLDNQLNPLKNKLLDHLRTQLSAEEVAAMPANDSNDLLVGGSLADSLKGGKGNDTLLGAEGDVVKLSTAGFSMQTQNKVTTLKGLGITQTRPDPMVRCTRQRLRKHTVTFSGQKEKVLLI